MKKFMLIFSIARICFYIAFLGFFAFVPLGLIEKESLCTWYNTFGIVCSTCGYTRGFANFMHFDFVTAFQFNPVLTLFAAPAFFFVMLQDVYIIIKRAITKKDELSFLEFLFRPHLYFSA